MFSEAFETWLVPGSDTRRRIQHTRTRAMIATIHTDSAEGHLLFAAMRDLIRAGGGTLFDVDQGRILP